MKQRTFIAVATALVFAVGFWAGVSYEYHRPLPAPPGPMMGEFVGRHGGGGPSRQGPPPMSRAQVFAEVEKLRPEIEAFQKRVDDIDDQFEKELDPILTPEQRVLNAKRLKRHAEFRKATESQPLSDEQLMHILNWPSWMLFRVVSLQVGYDFLNRDMKFDAAQGDKVHDLLRARRQSYLDLIDTLPPPSLTLMHLVPYIQRMDHSHFNGRQFSPPQSQPPPQQPEPQQKP